MYSLMEEIKSVVAEDFDDFEHRGLSITFAHIGIIGRSKFQTGVQKE